ncbi:cryptochrome/photolyase family protein [Acidocella sp. KAb 2-4]|uniref:cryptochrome/photolyase family protein n=1 Tax=Acidocella sp. KAb 2-4 TaxID=2885158 RepID=UPI001D0742D4|nr:cryptochrome/photolyase family protein [Acidocella sp. KAb 2-4]MCB5945614.1 cryptochrome/photolyase family protein [Acidocella sp. KAb 2-4]
MTRLFPVLGDQLSLGLPSLAMADKARDVVLMMEVRAEAITPRHHKKKIAFLLSAMRHFAQELRAAGYKVDYVTLDDPDNTQSFAGEIARAQTRHGATGIIATWPGEYRVAEMLRGLGAELLEDTRFLSTRADFAAWAEGRKQLRMEFFYRQLRARRGVLMRDGEPEGGQWNFDTENRKPLPPGLTIPPPYAELPDALTEAVLALVERQFPDHFGDLRPFAYAVTRVGALAALRQFIAQRLSRFGDYQDAMRQGEPWLFHSHIALYLNCGLLLPGECIAAAEAAYRAGAAPLNAAEGFIRQILGWREYVRGLYWLKMPGYAAQNALGATRPLPEFYWTGETEMNCLRQCVAETRANAYAHHIQRLMVLGNFALLAGLDPRAVNEWYLLVYADAYEWVELPNVSGMVLFADGGLLASKPYAAGGAYINRMSDYCRHCRYDVTQKTGPRACPFNALYWDFLARHRDTLARNPRLALAYKNLGRMAPEALAALRARAGEVLAAL